MIQIKSIYFQHLARSSKLLLSSSQVMDRNLLIRSLKPALTLFNIYEDEEDYVPETVIRYIHDSKCP